MIEQLSNGVDAGAIRRAASVEEVLETCRPPGVRVLDLAVRQSPSLSVDVFVDV